MTNKINTRNMVLAAMFIALGVILPQAFHIFGQASGMTFLPIHIPVMLSGMILGPIYGGSVGVLVTIISGVLTGMPAVPKLYFMVFELLAYGVATGFFVRRCKLIPTLLLSMVVGRVVYGLTLIMAVQLIGVNYPFANTGAFLTGITTGMPGIVIQLVVLPILYKMSQRWMDGK